MTTGAPRSNEVFARYARARLLAWIRRSGYATGYVVRIERDGGGGERSLYATVLLESGEVVDVEAVRDYPGPAFVAEWIWEVTR